MEDKVDVPSDGNQSSFRSIFPGYALYKFHANRPKSAANQSSEKKSQSSSVSEFLTREAKADDNFSLNVILTSLNAENEMELRKFLAKRLSKGTTYAGSGHIAGLDLSVDSEEPEAGSALCYYTLLRQEANNPLDSGAADVIADTEASSSSSSYTSNEFLLCLLASHDVTLDLFRPELNQFSQKVLEMLESDPILKYDLEGCEEFSSLEAHVWPCLEHWYEHVSRYLTRCVHALQEALRYVIHASLMDSKLEVKCSDSELKEDIMRFASICSLSEMLDSSTVGEGDPETTATATTSTPLVSLTTGSESILGNTPTVTLTRTDDDATWVASPDACSDFCEVWAANLVTADENNSQLLRQMIDNYKLKVIQDMNTLKRHLRQAETDYYALYRCHVFLRMCGNSEVLLKHVAREASAAAGGGGHEGSSHDVLRVLHNRLQLPRSHSTPAASSAASA